MSPEIGCPQGPLRTFQQCRFYKGPWGALKAAEEVATGHSDRTSTMSRLLTEPGDLGGQQDGGHWALSS